MRSIVVGFAFILSASALAGPPSETSRIHQAQSIVRPHADCYCRAQGRMVAYGESICLRTPEGPRLAQCAMSSNVTSWTITSLPCPES